MHFFVKVITALLVGCLSTVQADQTKSELGMNCSNALRESNNLVEISEIQSKIWSHWYELPRPLCRCSLFLIKALRHCSLDRLRMLLPNSAR